MRGRPPRPREERIREGATRALPEPVRVAGKAALADVLEPPTELSKPAAAWYREVVSELADSGLIERVDTFLLAMVAAAWGDFVIAEAVRRDQGWFTEGSQGQVVLGPWMKARRDSMVVFERLVNHLPLSPVARARLGLAGLRAASIAQAMDQDLGSSVVVDGDVVDADVVDVGLPGL